MTEPTLMSEWRHALRRQSLAVVSLALAIASLGYTTWRNETTERHRNVREAAFAMLGALGELQQLADTRFYGDDHGEMNRIAVWGRVALLRDLSGLVSPSVDARTAELYRTWSEHAAAFDQGDASAEKAVATAITATRTEVRTELMRLR